MDELKRLYHENVFDNITVPCPDCAGMGDDDQYTCETCWCEGGNGTIDLNTIVGNAIKEKSNGI